MVKKLTLWVALLGISHVVARHQAHHQSVPGALGVDQPQGRDRGLSEKLLDLLGISSEPVHVLAERERRAAVEPASLLEPEGEALAELATKANKKKLLGDRKHFSSFRTPLSGGDALTDGEMWANDMDPANAKEVPVPVPLPDNMEQPKDEFAAKDDATTPKAPIAGDATFDVAAEASTSTALDTLLMLEKLLNMTENTTTSLLQILEDGHQELRRTETVNQELDRRIAAMQERARSLASTLSLLEATGSVDEASRAELAAQSAAVAAKLRRFSTAGRSGTDEAASADFMDMARDAQRLDVLAEHCHRRATSSRFGLQHPELSALEQHLAGSADEAADSAAWRHFGGHATPRPWQVEELCESLADESSEVEAISSNLLSAARAVAGGA